MTALGWIGRTALIVLAGCLIGVETAASARTWSLVESATTRIITDDAPAIAGTLLDELLLTRTMLKQIASIEPPVPLRVFALKDRKSLTDFAPARLKRGNIHTFGFSHTGPHAAFIALRTDRPEALRAETLRHEYAHVLTATLSPDAPAWLDEGLSEFWSALVVEGDRLFAGRPVARHVELLRKRKWLPLATVITQPRGSLPSDSGEVALFYAQSWAMVHYLMLGANGNAVTNFMPSSSTLTGQFQSTIQQYVEAGRFKEAAVPWQPPAAAPAAASILSEARALAERANLLLSGEQPQAALPVARAALAIDPNEPLALEVTGAYYFLNNQPDQARQWLTRALTNKTNSYAAALYMSLLATSPADRERYLMIAVRSKPDSSVAWQRLSGIFEDDGRLELARRWCRAWSRQALAAFFIGSPPSCGVGGRP